MIESTGAPRYAAKMKAPFAMLGLRTNGHALSGLTYLPLDEPAAAPADPIALLAVRELERYLEDPDFRFTVPLAPAGTSFQLRVWAALSEIPRGKCRTYGDMAHVLGTAARAVGQACGANRIALIIPCHRVIGSQGGLGGFMHARDGDPLAIKRWLLAHEGQRFDD